MTKSDTLYVTEFYSWFEPDVTVTERLSEILISIKRWSQLIYDLHMQ